jgi:hypothetical protein
MPISHRIIDRVNIHKFKQKVRYYPRTKIYCTSHTFFRLSDRQKLKLTCDDLRDFLKDKYPEFVGLQENCCYAVFYKYPRQRLIRIIIDIKPGSINIITFYMLKRRQRPVIK